MMQTGEAHFTFPVPYEVAEVLKAKPDLEVVAAPSIVLRYLSMNTQQKPFDNPKVRAGDRLRDQQGSARQGRVQRLRDAGRRRGAAGRRVRGQDRPVAVRRRQGEAAADRGRLPERLRDRAVVGVQPHDRAEGHAVPAAAAAAGRHQDEDHAARGRPARRESRELAGSGDRAGAPVLRRLVDVDRRSRLGAAPAAVRRIVAAEASSTPRTTRTTKVDADIKKARSSTTDSAEKAKLYKDAQETIWNDAPWAPLVVEQLLSAHNKKLSGVYVIPDASFNFDEIDSMTEQVSLAALARYFARVESREGSGRPSLRVHAQPSAHASRDAQYIAKRLLGLLPTLLIVGLLVFLFVHLLPGDPARLAAGPDADAGNGRARAQGPGTRPARCRSSSCASSAACCAGDFGTSLRTKRPVATEIADRFMPTFWLTVWSMAVVGAVRHGDRHRVRRVAQPLARPHRHDARGVGHLVSGIRARHGADAGLLGAAGLAADRGRRHVAPLHPAVAHARRRGRGDHGALHALVVRRDPRRGLHPHRARQGPRRAPRRHQARTAQRADSRWSR